MDITAHILKLAKDGLTDVQIVERLDAEGIRNNKNEPFTANAVRSRRERARKEKGVKPKQARSDITEMSEGEDSALPSETDLSTFTSDISELSDFSLDLPDQSDMPEISETLLPEHWKRQIIQIIQTELRRTMQQAQAIQTVPKFQMGSEIPLPPEPTKIEGPKGKPIALGKRVKIAGTCDEQLYNHLEQWRKGRGITLSKALDVVIWSFFGQPTLSFQTSDSSTTSDSSDASALPKEIDE